jgi:hypothetical protein
LSKLLYQIYSLQFLNFTLFNYILSTPRAGGGTVDTLASGASESNLVRVQIPPRAPRVNKINIIFGDRLVVGQWPLKPLTGVRVPVPEPKTKLIYIVFKLKYMENYKPSSDSKAETVNNNPAPSVITGNEGHETHPLAQDINGEPNPQDRATDWSHHNDPNVPSATDS